jgi:hypothetical protein
LEKTEWEEIADLGDGGCAAPAGRVVSFLGFETLPDGGVAMTRGSGV